MRHGVVLSSLLHDVTGVARHDQHAIARVTEAECSVAGREHLGLTLDGRDEAPHRFEEDPADDDQQAEPVDERGQDLESLVTEGAP